MRKLLALFLLSAVAHAELIPSARLADWAVDTKVGVTGGIPTRSTLIDVTQAPYNADNTGATDAQPDIADALAAATSGDVVYLPTGTYRCDNPITPKSNVTIRGAGTAETIIQARGSIGSALQLDPSWFITTPTNVVSGLTAGSDTIIVTSNTDFAVGQPARIVWPNDPDLPVIHAYGSANVRSFTCLIAGVSGTTITISPPLPGTFVNVGTATMQPVTVFVPPVVYAGLEDLTIDGYSTNMTVGIQWQLAANSWIKNVKIQDQQNYAIQLYDNVLTTVTHSWISAGGEGTNHSGLLTERCSGLYVYDNIIENNQPGFEINQNTAGSVFAYNLVLCALIGIDTNHGPHNSFNLYEGNITNNVLSDGFFGGESELTIFRNWILSFNAETEAASSSGVGLRRWTRNASLIGNIIQKDGLVYGNDSVSLGFPNIGNGDFEGTAPPWRDYNESTGATVYSGTLTTRTDATHGIITVTGTIANLLAPYRGDDDIAFGSIIVRVTSSVGATLTVDCTPHASTLPALSTTADIWASVGGFQEMDDDVEATLVRKGNYVYFDDAIDVDPSPDSIPDSLYLDGKPTWFLNRTWPPFDSSNVGTPSYEDIPAGYRYVNGQDPTPSGTTTFSGSGATTLSGSGTTTITQ